MSNSIAPGSSADVNVRVTALTTNPNVPVTYKTIILKKNLVNGVNTFTQAMMNQTNTKYVIKYDFTLGANINIPSNCILEFDGGSISANGNNDTITGANTGIQAGLVKIFNTNVTLAGDFKNKEWYVEWFGISINNTTKSEENANILNDLFGNQIVQGKKIIFPKGIIYINRQINSKYGKLTVEGCGGAYGLDADVTTIKASDDFIGDYILYFGYESPVGYYEQWRSISINNINIDCSFLCGGLRCGSYDCGKLLNISICSIKYDKTGLYYGINNINQHRAVSQNSSIENVCVWKGLDPKSVATSPAVVLRGVQECVINTLNGAIFDTYNDVQLNPNIAGIEMIDCNGSVLNACSPCSEHVGLKIINCNNITINTPIMEATGAPLYIDSKYIKTTSGAYVNIPSIGDIVHQNNGFSGRITNVGTDSPYMKDCIGTLETGNLYNENNEVVCNITGFSYQYNTNIVVNNLRSFNRQQRYNFNSIIRYTSLSNLDLYSTVIGEQPKYDIDKTVISSIIRANINGILNNNSPSKVEYIDVAYCNDSNLSSIQSSIWTQTYKNIHFNIKAPALLQVPAGGDSITRYEIKDAEFELIVNEITGLYEMNYISGNIAILGNKILGTKKSYITLPNSDFSDTDFRDIGGDVMFITTEISVMTTITIQSNWMGRIITDAPKDINITSSKSIIVNGVDSGNTANIRSAKTPIEIIGNTQTLYINYLV